MEYIVICAFHSFRDKASSYRVLSVATPVYNCHQSHRDQSKDELAAAC